MSEELAQISLPGAENEGQFYMQDGDTAGYNDAGERVPVQYPVKPAPELELLNELEEHGAKFDNVSNALAVVCDWIERHGTKSRDDRQGRQEFERRAIVSELLKLLTAGATPLQAGERALCLAFKLNLTPYKQQNDLAAAIKKTPTRVSQICAAFHCLVSEIGCKQ